MQETNNSLEQLNTWTKIIDNTSQASDTDMEYSFSSLGVDVSKINEILLVIRYAFRDNQANMINNTFYTKEQLIDSLQNSKALSCQSPYNSEGYSLFQLLGKGNLNTFACYYYSSIQSRGYEVWVR